MLKQMKRLKIVRRLTRLFFQASATLPVKKKQVMFESYSGKQYSCNPRAIYEYLKAEETDYELIWSVNRDYVKEFQERNIPYIKRLSLRWFFELARSRYWVTNSRMPNWLNKPSHTIYLQTWHGTPLKKLAADMEDVRMPGTNREQYVRNFHEETANWDYLISPNPYSTEIFKRAFQFHKEMLETGYPRNDQLVNGNTEQTIVRIKKELEIPLDKKVILYAPTWRDHHNAGPGSYHFDLKLDLERCKEQLGDDYVVLMRLHSFITKAPDFSEHNGFVFDVTKNQDINELYLISDLLVTDYSSVFFDFAILKRPIIFFTYDLEEYRDDIRGFYFSLEKHAPGPIVKTTDECIQAIERAFKENDERKYEAFYNKFCLLDDGKATSRVVQNVFKAGE
ncbi:CDP-glycerol glycerophosphotransferase family protein [Shouchella lehensis]|uniref:CDP-glycerol glycerophosphotransferase family protein n=2 Tax=Shouchella lehensis TaxID=300825 RepID=A0A4Y7WSC3_9BACI|nr:CDP-glycerol glycerophosphotransferase family protein [Shouchella lehensis]MBG9783664.1 CDP-glycerol:glycerophosphate glycerophosphotransferase [Shouchella lehensis]TES51388.1 CDP-glycerol glycerophosphotransferase family protein [Shouchella lehensis]